MSTPKDPYWLVKLYRKTLCEQRDKGSMMMQDAERIACEAVYNAALSSPAVTRLRTCAECGMCSVERCEGRLP